MLSHDDPLPQRPMRVLVAGVSGSGKTTLARRIAAVTGAGHTEIDALFHGPGWRERSEFIDDVRALVAAETWTTEWQYGPARPLLAARADLMVWLDLPFWRVTFPRVVGRTFRRRLRGEELWNGNVEPPLRTVFTDPDHIVRWAVRTRRDTGARMRELEREHPELPIVRLTGQAEVDAWIAGPLDHSQWRDLHS